MIKAIIKKYYPYIIGIVILTIIEALIILSLPDYMSKIITNGIGQNDLNYIYNIGTLMVLITLLSVICAIFLSYISAKLGALVASDLRINIYEKIINMDEAIIDEFPKSSLLTRTTNDINQISTTISNFIRMTLFAIILGIGGIIKAITKSSQLPSLTLILIIGILLVMFFLIFIFCLVIKKFEKLQTILDKINHKTKEILEGTLVIRAFTKERKEELNFQKINLEYNSLEYFLNKIMALLNPYMTLIMNGVVIAIICLATNKASNISDISNMLAFSQYSTQVISSFLTLSIIFILLPKAKVSYSRINEVLNTSNELIINDSSNWQHFNKEIEYKNISFQYQNSTEYALKNITFKLEKGKTYGIIGATASGKTTLIKLLCHLYDPTSGKILIDNQDLKNISPKKLLKEIAYIPKESSLFQGTIKDNLKDGNNEATEIEMQQALKNACADFITNLNTLISENGTNFSGGEKQRLSIARGLIKNSNILIIDDALSALDYKTDLKVRQNITKKYPNQTKIIISSRIASIMNANKILVLDKGELIAFDNHHNLIKNCPIYKEMVLSQLGNEGDKNE